MLECDKAWVTNVRDQRSSNPAGSFKQAQSAPINPQSLSASGRALRSIRNLYKLPAAREKEAGPVVLLWASKANVLNKKNHCFEKS